MLGDPVDEHGEVGEAHRVALGAAGRSAEARRADLGRLVGSVVDDQRAAAVALERRDGERLGKDQACCCKTGLRR